MKIPWLMDCDYASYKWFGMFIDEKMKNSMKLWIRKGILRKGVWIGAHKTKSPQLHNTQSNCF